MSVNWIISWTSNSLRTPLIKQKIMNPFSRSSTTRHGEANRTRTSFSSRKRFEYFVPQRKGSNLFCMLFNLLRLANLFNIFDSKFKEWEFFDNFIRHYWINVMWNDNEVWLLFPVLCLSSNMNELISMFPFADPILFYKTQFFQYSYSMFGVLWRIRSHIFD